jgi:uncharacterized phage-associated protein
MTPSTQRNQPTAKDCAAYILHLGGRDEVRDIDQFKLLKTLYFAQAYSMAMRGRPLFAESVEAWKGGPVVRGIWEAFTQWQDRPIPPCAPPSDEALSQLDRRFLEAVWEDLRHLTGKQLADLSHEPGPWATIYGTRPPGAHCSEVIPQELMKSDFRRMMGLHP